jgi:DNA-binding IclR family transcriptional regulator
MIGAAAVLGAVGSAKLSAQPVAKTFVLVHGVTDPDVLDKQLDLVEAQGYAWIDGELDPAICGIAVPLRDHAGRVVAAISINTISGKASEAQAKKKFLVPLKRTAQDIRTQMVAVRQPAF